MGDALSPVPPSGTGLAILNRVLISQGSAALRPGPHAVRLLRRLGPRHVAGPSSPGLDIAEQGARGQTELLSTSYREYERQIRKQMLRLFAPAGFDPRRDIAGIILNRWGHAYVDPQPGFYFGKNGRQAPRDIIRRPFGRIAFAHSELVGHQYWLGAIGEGRRAATQLLS